MQSEKKYQSEKLSFAQFLNVVRWIIGFNISLSPQSVFIYAFAKILIDLNPLLNAYIFAKILDKIIKIASMPHSQPTEIIPLLILLLGYNLINSGLNQLYYYFSGKLYSLAEYRSKEKIHQHLRFLGIQTLENPGITNKIYQAGENIGRLTSDLDRVINFISRLITLGSSLVIVLTTMPILVLVVFVSVLPSLLSNQYFLKKDWKFYRDETENRRRANHISTTLSESANLHEITIASAFHYLNGKFKKFADYYIAGELKIMKSWSSFSFLFGSLTEVASIFGYFSILKNLLYHVISVGTATFQMRSLDIFINNLIEANNGFSTLYERCSRDKAFQDIFMAKPMIADGAITMAKSHTPPLISIQKISFRYPGGSQKAINDLSLEIRPGEKIAIVGENGAGKTTLIKLLARFYQAGEGTILLDNQNINDIKIESWYANLGVLFQDYNTYPYLTLKENVYLGQSSEELDMQEIEKATHKANVASLVSEYPNGFEQVLSEKFKGGTRPSTGQWQKIAIARFFYRQAPVVIFDEPTASIDAISESQIFNQIYDFFKGKTVIIISHRFSTVRNADRIYVMNHGSIVEGGTHDELVKKQGEYARAFNVQAEGYQ